MLLSRIEADIAKGEAAWRDLVERDVPGFDRRLIRFGRPPLSLQTPTEPETLPDHDDDEELDQREAVFYSRAEHSAYPRAGGNERRGNLTRLFRNTRRCHYNP